jgi:hypothetical protein
MLSGLSKWLAREVSFCARGGECSGLLAVASDITREANDELHHSRGELCCSLRRAMNVRLEQKSVFLNFSPNHMVLTSKQLLIIILWII